MASGALKGLALLTAFSGCFHNTFECEDGGVIPNDEVNDGVPDCQGRLDWSDQHGWGLVALESEDERYMSYLSKGVFITLTIVYTLTILVLMVFPVSHRGYLQIKSDYVAAMANYDWGIYVFLVIFILLFGFSKHKMKVAEEEKKILKTLHEADAKAYHKRKIQNAKRWREQYLDSIERRKRIAEEEIMKNSIKIGFKVKKKIGKKVQLLCVKR